MPKFNIDSSATANEIVGGVVSPTSATSTFVTVSVFYAETASWAGFATFAETAGSSTYSETSSFANLALTASLVETASFANSASVAYYSNYAELANNANSAVSSLSSETSSLAISASTALYADYTPSASFALTADYTNFATSATNATNATNAETSSVAISASTALYSDNTISSSFALSADYTNFATSAGSATNATNAETSSLALSASNSLHALYAETAATASSFVSSSHALVSDTSLTSDYATSAGSSDTSTSASHALVSDSSITATSAGSATTSTSASHALYADSATTSVSATTSTSASHAVNADNATTAVSATSATSADTSVSASHAVNSDSSITSQTSDTSVSSSHSLVADTALLLLGTVESASFAETASYLLGQSPTSSHALTADNAYQLNSQAGAYYLSNTNMTDRVLTTNLSGQYDIVVSTATSSVSASHSLIADEALTYNGSVTSASHAVQSDSSLTSDFATTATSASHALISDEALTYNGSVVSASHALNADSSITSQTSVSSSHSLIADEALTYNGSVTSASHAVQSDSSTSASHALITDEALTYNGSVISSSYAETASFAMNGGGGSSIVAKTITGEYTVLEEDKGKFLAYTRATLKFPVIFEDTLSDDFYVYLMQSGSGQFYVSSSLSITAYPTSSEYNSVAGKGAVLTAYRKGSTDLVLWGDLGKVLPPAQVTAPTMISASYANNTASVFWSSNDSTEIGYELQRSIDSGSNWDVSVGLPSGSLVYRDTNVSTGSTYWYQVRSYNDYYTSSFSATASVYIPIPTIDPSGITNLYAWYDANDVTGSNNDLINAWVDSSGNGRIIVVPTSDYKPTLKTNIVNGNNAVQFIENVTGDKLWNESWYSSYSATQPMTIVAIVSGSDAISDGVLTGISLAGATHDLHIGQDSTFFKVIVNGAGIAVSNTTVPNPINVWSKIIIDWNQEGVASSASYNDTLVGTATLTKTFTGPTFSIGARPYSSHGLPWLGYVAELIVYEKKLTSDDRQLLSDYFSSKYGI